MNKVIKNTIGSLVLGTVLALVAVFTPLAPSVAAQCDPSLGIQGGVNCTNSDSTPDNLFAADGIFVTIVNILLFIIGAISVIMLIIGGIRYTTSAGDSGNVTGAKNTILYAIIGLVVAFLAYAVVNWVIVALSNGA
jgi:hypothetical protein